MNKKSFTFYIEWRDVLQDFSEEVRLEVYDAIIEYVASGTLPELKPLSKMAFAFIKKMIDCDEEKACELRRKRSEGGRKGMRNRYNSSNSLNSLITPDNKEIPLKENPPTPLKESTPKEKEKPPKGGKKKTPTLGVLETIEKYRSESTSDPYLKFLDWLETNAPYVFRNIHPLSEIEFDKLKAAYGSKTIVENILNIENRKDLRKKYSSLYRTLLNWCKNGYN